MIRRRAVPLTAVGLLVAAVGLLPARGGPAPPAAAVATVVGTTFTPPWAPHPRPAAEPIAQEPPADPFPIRRVLVPADKLATIAPPAGGALRRLPRDEFETLVRRAATAVAAADAAPRLVEARYRAALTDAGLTGTGEWVVVNPKLAAGPVPLEPLRVAVWKPRWPDGKDALLYHPAGGTTVALWAEAPGGRVAFDWSARGVEEPGELRFDLRLPPAPVAVLDLDLPAGRVPVPTQAEVLVAGPLPAADGRAGWRIVFGGQSRAEFTVRGPGGAGQLPLLTRAAAAARFDLAPGQAEARFEFDLDPVRGPVDAWEFDADPALRVIDAVANARESWRVVPGEAGKPNRLVVRLREPAAGGRVAVTTVAPFPADGQPWACPMVRPVAAAAGAETIELRFGPDLRPDGWDAGDYRTTQAAATPDRGYAVTLTGTLTPADAPARRPPAVRASAAGPEFATTGQVDWRIDSAGSRLAGRFRIKVLRGPLTQIPFKLPAGFTPEPGVAIPDDPAAAAGPGADGRWVVEPSRPLAAGQTADVPITLRGPPGPPPPDPAAAGSETRVTIPFPHIVPLTAGPREGTYTVAASAAYRAWPAPPPAEPGDGIVYKYVGREPDGSLTLAPRRPRVVVDCDTAVSLADGNRLVVETRLRPRAEAGELSWLTVFAPGGGGWNWSVTAGGATVRPHPAGPLLPWLPALAGGPPVGLSGRLWRVTYPRPAADGGEVVVRATHLPPAGSVVAPLPVVLGADLSPPNVTLDAAAAARFDPVTGPDPAVPQLVRSLSLHARGAPPAAEATAGWRFADLTVTTRVADGGAVVGVLAGRVTAAAGGAVPVALPAGVDVESATVGGKWAAVPDGRRVLLPVPDPGADGVPFELRYRLPGPVGPVAARVESPFPELPGDPAPVRRAWLVGPGYRLWPGLAPVADGPDAVRVIDTRMPEVVGLALAAVFLGCAAGWLVGGPPGRVGWALLIGAAAGLGAAGWLVPDGWQPVVRPPTVAALGAVVVGAVRRVRPPAAGGRTSSLVPLTAAGVLAGWIGAWSAAQAPGPAVVYVVPGPAGGSDSVFAPQPVFDRLAALAASPLPPALVTAAEYVGRGDDTTATFDATFIVHCTRDGDHTLILPLTGVRLESMRLDGAPAYPDAARPDHLAVAVRGRGRHELTARFGVPVAATGGDREVRFGVPDVPAGRLTFALPVAARQITVPTRRGDQRNTAGPDGTTVRADLGGGRVAAVRWRSGGPADGKQVVSVTEAAVWDLGDDETGVTAAFVYRVEQGSLARVRIELPPGLEPGRVGVRAVDAAAPGGAANGVKGWALEPAADGWQAFVVTLQTPAEGRVAVTLRLYPRRPPAGRPVLLFPRATEVAAADSYYGVRLAGVAADGWEKAGLIDFPTTTLAQEFAAVPELELEKRPLARAFRREGSAAPLLKPGLRPTGDVRPISQEIVWHLGPRAMAEGTVRWPRDAAVARAEFDVPGPVAVADVRAADLAGWSRAGTRVQVWFRGPPKDATVRWVGDLTGYPVVAGKPPPDPVAVDLPFPPGADKGTTARVRAADGWATAGGREVALAADPAGPPPRVQLYPPRPGSPVRVWQTAGPDGDGIGWRAVVEVGRPANRPLAFTLRVGNLPAGAEPKLELPSGATVADAGAGDGAKMWAVTVPAEVPGPVRAAVAARLPAGAALPTAGVLFAGVPAGRVGRWLSTGGGLRPADRLAVDPGGWPADVPRGEPVWRVEGDEPVRLATAPTPDAPPPPIAPASPASEEPAANGTWLDPAAGRWLTAAGWAVGFGLVGLLLARGPRRLWPEGLVLLGLAAAAAAGPAFLAVSAVGGLARLAGTGRRFSRVVMR